MQRQGSHVFLGRKTRRLSYKIETNSGDVFRILSQNLEEVDFLNVIPF